MRSLKEKSACLKSKQKKQSKKRGKAAEAGSEDQQAAAAAPAAGEPAAKKARVVIVVDMKGPSNAEVSRKEGGHLTLLQGCINCTVPMSVAV